MTELTVFLAFKCRVSIKDLTLQSRLHLLDSCVCVLLTNSVVDDSMMKMLGRASHKHKENYCRNVLFRKLVQLLNLVLSSLKSSQ
jgi:hypothetical protein